MFCLVSCTSKNPQTGSESSQLSSAPNPATYIPRVGVAVSTSARTCMAIRNANLSVGSPVTLVTPFLPQKFVQVEIGGQTSEACPVSKEVDPAVYSYNLRIAQDSIQKLEPLIAVVGTSAAFSTPNNNVQADLDQNGKAETFRACTSNDGVHLTLWSGKPIDGSVLWHGYYYEPDNPATGPPCTPRETASSSSGS